MTGARKLSDSPGGRLPAFLTVTIESSPNGIGSEVRQFLLDSASSRLFNHRARVLMALLAYARYEDARGEHEVATASRWLISSVAGSAVASHTGLDCSNVFRALRALVKEGCISRIAPGAGRGDNVGRAAVYRIC